MKRWRLILVGAVAASLLACGLAGWRAAVASPYALVPRDASDVRVLRSGLLGYQTSYQAASGYWEWRGPIIRRLAAAGWVRGSSPDSAEFDRTLWFVRRRELGALSMLEQLSIRTSAADQPLVVLTYRRTLMAPLIGRLSPP